MDRETVRTLPEAFPGCSWAIWSERFPADGCVEEDPNRLEAFVVSNVDRLDGRVVMLSLNPSGVEPEGYRNFHSPAGKHYDDRLKRFVQDDELTNLVGAYMTDIVPDVVDPDSQNVTPEDVDVERFVDQLEFLGHDEYDVICFSAKAFEAIRDFLSAAERSMPQDVRSFAGSKDGVRIDGYRVWHYSNWGANADKVPALERQLAYLDEEVVD